MKLIPEERVPGRPLGRHIEHDPKSKDFAFGVTTSTTHLKSVHHRRYGHIFDQETQGADNTPLGSCTGNATAGAINSVPIHHSKLPILRDSNAVKIYSLATTLDDYPGTYPPDDTGSSGLAAAKAAQQLGYIKVYQHAFSIEAALSALQSYPLITGVKWYEGFDNPSKTTGLVEISGQVRGGHEFEVIGFEWEGNVDDSHVICVNSWTSAWGISGRFKMTVKTWRTLLDDEGDATILIN